METRASVAYKFYVKWLHYSEVECHVLLLLPRKGVMLQGHGMLPQEGVLRQEDVLPRMGVKCYVRKTCYTRMVCVKAEWPLVERLEWPVVERLEWPVKGWNGLLLSKALRLEWPLSLMGVVYSFISCWVDWERGCRGVSKCGSRASQPPCFPATWFCTVFRTWPRRGIGESIRPFYTSHTSANLKSSFPHDFRRVRTISTI